MFLFLLIYKYEHKLTSQFWEFKLEWAETQTTWFTWQWVVLSADSLCQRLKHQHVYSWTHQQHCRQKQTVLTCRLSVKHWKQITSVSLNLWREVLVEHFLHMSVCRLVPLCPSHVWVCNFVVCWTLYLGWGNHFLEAHVFSLCIWGCGLGLSLARCFNAQKNLTAPKCLSAGRLSSPTSRLVPSSRCSSCKLATDRTDEAAELGTSSTAMMWRYLRL